DSLRVEHGEFSRDGVLLRTVARSAFHPLAEWVDFVVHRAAPFVAAWSNAHTFDFAPFVVATGVTAARDVREALTPKGDPPNPGSASKESTPSRPRHENNAHALPLGSSPPATLPRSALPSTAQSQGVYEAVAECARLERAFLTSTDSIDAPSRDGLYEQLALVSNALGNGRDAAIYAARFLWNSDEPATLMPKLAPLRQSAEAVQDVNDAREHLLHFCLERAPSRSSLQAAAGLVHRFFDTMDLVSLWNACGKLGRDTGDDLALAQWRDRILVRVRDDEDLRAGWPTVFRAWAFRHGSQELPFLEQIQEEIGSTARTRSPVEAPIVLTRAYASLILAKAYAYVGRTQESERHVLLGRAGLESADPVHQVLRAMFTERIEGVSRTGRSYGPYSTHLESMYLGLDRAARYKIDRLRSALLSLESVERVRPFDSFRSQSVDPSQDEFASLRKPSAETFAANFDAVLTRANAGDDMQRVRIVEGLSDFLARFPPSEASRPILALLSASQSIQADLPRAKTQLRLLSCAAHLSSVQAFEDASGHTLESVARVTERASLVSELLEALPIFLRTGHGEMIRPFLERAAGTAPVDERVLAVGGLARLGVRDFVVPLEEAILHFEKSDSLSKVRQAHLWSRSMAAFPSDIRKEMLRVLLRGFSSISDSYSTNSHFCLSVLEYTEAIAFAVSLPSRTPSVELIDQDERALRKRIERDTARLSVTEDVRSL
ncbi:MAG: hypothetical protein KBF88_17525, partial [Polyangiaceae bacterium]|nr:hypothetical protein [Polyangiaceae bacterium]